MVEKEEKKLVITYCKNRFLCSNFAEILETKSTMNVHLTSIEEVNLFDSAEAFPRIAGKQNSSDDDDEYFDDDDDDDDLDDDLDFLDDDDDDDYDDFGGEDDFY